MKRFAKTTLALSLTTGLLTASALVFADNNTNNNNNNISPSEKAKIENVIHDYLLQKPEVLIESLQNFQKKQYEQAEKAVKQTQQDAPQYKKILFSQASDPVAGNPNGTITVVEFFDYQCPHCVEMAPVLKEVIKANPNLRVVYKEWPIRGPISEFAAKAALAANKQGKYEVFSHAILEAKQPLDQDKILKIAKNVGLDVDKLQKDMNDSSIKTQIQENTKLAQDLKLFGTPAFFFGKTNDANGQVAYIPGQMNKAQMQEVIDKIK